MRLLLLSFVLLSTAAFARTEYQAALKTTFALSTTPDCTTCHNAVPEGCGNTQTKFALTLKTKANITMCPPAMSAAQTSVITTGLNAMKTDMTDSDMDGTSDLAELQAGNNPNVVGTGRPDGGTSTDGGKTTADGGVPMQGCSTTPDGSTVPVPLVLGALALLGLGVLRRQVAR